MPQERSFQFEATVEQGRYWLPQIADVAHVTQLNGPDFWTIVIRPHVANSCPVEMTVRANDRFDAVLAGESYASRDLPSHGFLVSLLESVAEGRVVQRRWRSSATGALHAVETLIRLSDGTVWTGSHGVDGGIAALEHHDRHFLPYRRSRF